MERRVQTLTEPILRPLVRKALADPTAGIESWRVEEIHGGWGGAIGGTALYRVAGRTRPGDAWSLVLKILYERAGENETSPYYWKREYELYRSGFLDHLSTTGLRAPSFLGFTEFPHACWIWMEDVPGDPNRSWTMADYHAVARRLGRFNGLYLTGEPIPDAPWLSDNWHCRIIPPLADTFERLDEYLQHPLIQRALPLAEKQAILAIWRERDRYCEALAGLPQTFCHLDAFHRNLFHSAEETVLIDWALAGRAAIGEELTTMVAISLYLPVFPLSSADALDKTVFDGYIQGLRDAGWTGDARLARLGYVCAMTLRGLAGVKQDIEVLLGKRVYPALPNEPQSNDAEARADLFADVRRFRLLKMANEARTLLAAP
jgi:tRNA A-37 threonylcarbamoyl transferase component Bud32